MSQTMNRQAIAENAIVHTAPPVRQTSANEARIDRGFELPRGLYFATAACYFGFLVIMASTVSTPGLIVPLAICAVFIAMFFAVPIAMLKQTPGAGKFVKSWGQLQARGISTYTGRLSGTDAAVQMMILPVLLVGWGLAVAVIVALT